MAKTTKRSGVKTAISIFLILIVTVAIVGLVASLTKDDAPPIIGSKPLALTLGDGKVENGSSIGLMDSGVEFKVAGSSKYNVKVFAYSTQENDFTLTVGAEPYTWGNFDGRNVTAGFDFTRSNSGFTVKHYGLNEVLSRVQNGMTVITDEFPPTAIFRMTVTTDKESVEVYFYVSPEVVDIEIDIGNIIL